MPKARPKNFVCKACEKAFQDREHLRRHESACKVKKARGGEEYVKCPQCPS